MHSSKYIHSSVSPKKASLLLRYTYAVWFVFCVGTLFVIALKDLANAREHFSHENELLLNGFVNRIQIAETSIEGFAAHLHEGQQDYSHLSRYAANLIQRYPFLYMFEVAEKVVNAERQSMVEQHQSVFPGFYIRRFDYEKTRHWVKVEDKDTYFPITFQHPYYQDNRNILGLDLYSSDFLKEAMEKSHQKGMAVASRPFILAENKKGYVIHRSSINGHEFQPAALKSDRYALLALVSNKIFAQPNLIDQRLEYVISYPEYLSEDKDSGIVYKKADENKRFLAHYILPRLTYQKDMSAITPSQPFVIKTGLQLHWQDFSYGLMLVIAGLMVLVPVISRSYVHNFLSEELLKLDDKEELYQLANFDQLTALPNRTRLFDHIEIMIAKGMRQTGRFHIFFIDIDNFKPVNDEYGHSVGDYVLYEFSLRLSNHLRDNELLARLGGDEFVLVVDEDMTKAHADKFKQRITQLFEQPILHGQKKIYLKFSIGEAVFPNDGKNIQSLLDFADRNMYENKQKRKKRLQVVS